jgi:hypothetical protein
LIKNDSEQEELSNIIAKENFIDTINSGNFCQIPLCLIDNEIIPICNGNGNGNGNGNCNSNSNSNIGSDIIFKFN